MYDLNAIAREVYHGPHVQGRNKLIKKLADQYVYTHQFNKGFPTSAYVGSLSLHQFPPSFGTHSSDYKMDSRAGEPTRTHLAISKMPRHHKHITMWSTLTQATRRRFPSPDPHEGGGGGGEGGGRGGSGLIR